MAKNYQMNTKDTQYKKIFKLDNRKKQSQSSVICAAEIKGKSKSSMPSAGSKMVLIDYNHTPGKVQQKQEIKGKKSDDNSNNDKYFSGYIDRVKNKMRTTISSVGVVDGGGGGDGGSVTRKVATRRDSLNDRISHYINRAKLKIRTTTIVERCDHM
ncbi:hypothetical protein K7X08_023429 [Anisodus acutangulus]|uniref:Uncharacterized protein n=1 Tax=Anisodus acutangulus TaxID=402998 RepID=A0A9Q1R0L6_9SOLA|nr:hypothetical protein K7X08_023429 [Anisodus acutangulus]